LLLAILLSGPAGWARHKPFDQDSSRTMAAGLQYQRSKTHQLLWGLDKNQT